MMIEKTDKTAQIKIELKNRIIDPLELLREEKARLKGCKKSPLYHEGGFPPQDNSKEIA